VINSSGNSPLYSRAIDPKCDHTLYGVLITKSKSYLYLCLELHRIALSKYGTKSSWSTCILPSLRSVPITFFHQHSSTCVLRFHQLVKTKLGTFTPISNGLSPSRERWEMTNQFIFILPCSQLRWQVHPFNQKLIIHALVLGASTTIQHHFWCLHIRYVN
jgi:hypothetical protein